MNPRDEFRSKLEDILPAKELRFSPTPAFQGYKHYLSHAIAHPAKMNMHLLRFLIENFTEKGDVVLDPMAGSGSTGVVASLHGRNAVCVDIEEKFHKWMEQARRKVEGQKTFTEKGWIRNICGDARKLSELLKEIDVVEKNIGNLPFQLDAIITSPPYEGSLSQDHNEEKETKKALRKSGKNKGKPIALGRSQARTTYSELDENIKRLRQYGRTDPKAGGPYGRSLGHPYSPNKDNIGNLKKETYVEAMLKVYSEMFKVLKPNGKAIIVIKPFIRNKKVVDLPYHTWLLLKKVGFKLVQLFRLRLKQESFWRILYHKKYPEVPKIKHEYVLVCEKPLRKC